MRAALDYAPVVDHRDHIAVLDRAEPVRDDERRAAPVARAGDARNEPPESAILAPKGVASAVVAIVVARREVPE